ncbi:MAG: hypothetical protein K0U37_09495 [Gammaproteobacteria bacterium]|nr:hypothetical protein [Gammaproteobacteria bacterium]
MATINTIFKKLGFSSDYIQSLVSACLYVGDPSSSNAFEGSLAKISSSNSEKWASKLVNMSVTREVFPEVCFVSYNEWQSKARINEISDHEFDLSEMELFELIVCLTQLQFYGTKFSDFSGSTNIYENDEQTFVPPAVRNLFSGLGFTETKFPETSSKIDAVFLHAATEGALIPRLKTLEEILKQHPHVPVYYVTNPRGLGISEGSTSKILATWFSDEKAKQDLISEEIQSLFSSIRMRDQSQQLDWWNNLNALQKEILDVVNPLLEEKLDKFPSNPEVGIHYSEEYDQASGMEKRDLLMESWPIMDHFFDYHLGEKRIDLRVLPVVGKLINVSNNEGEITRYIPARTEDLLEAFFKDFSIGSEPVFIANISDQSVSLAGFRQCLMTDLMLESMDYRDKATFLPAYDALLQDTFNLERGLKEIAATIHTWYTVGNDKLSILLSNDKRVIHEVILPKNNCC